MNFYLRSAKFLANYLDAKFSFLGFRFGVSSIIDLIPGIGDIFDAAVSFYFIFVAFQLGVPDEQIGKMIFNIVFAFVIGLVPIIGDAAYLFYKPNRRNYKIIEKYNRHPVVTGQVVG